MAAATLSRGVAGMASPVAAVVAVPAAHMVSRAVAEGTVEAVAGGCHHLYLLSLAP